MGRNEWRDYMQQLSPTLKEISLHGTKSFPCAFYQTRSVGKGTLVKPLARRSGDLIFFRRRISS